MDTSVYGSSILSRQLISGSDDRPVSSAKMCSPGSRTESAAFYMAADSLLRFTFVLITRRPGYPQLPATDYLAIYFAT